MDVTALPSVLNRRLVTALRSNPTMAAQCLDRHDAAVPAFLHEYPPFPIGAWPMFISQQLVRDHFRPIGAALPKLIYKAVRLRFQEDSAAFTAYFGWPRRLYNLLLRSPIDPLELLMRYDAVLHGNELKVLEINCSSALGGWPLDWLQPELARRLGRFAETRAWHVGYRRIFEGMLRSLIDSILRRKAGEARGHLLFHAFVSEPRERASLIATLQAAYDEIKPPQLAAGRIFLFEEFDQIGFAPDGAVRVDDETMDAVLLSFPPVTGVPEPLMHQLTAAHLQNHIVFPDSPLHTLIGDKRLLALLHECRASGLLDVDEAELVDRYIPWTARLRDVQVDVAGMHLPLDQYLSDGQEAFVLKRADSYGGQHVVIGHQCDATQWRTAIACGMEDGQWVAQQFWPPGRLEIPHQQSSAEYDLIWGIFACGGSYAGAFVRAKRSTGRAGVINAANGATEFLVFEEAEATAESSDDSVQTKAREAAHALSVLNGRLIGFLENSTTARARVDTAKLPAFLPDSGKILSAWPIFVSEAVVTGPFTNIVASLPEVFYRALRAHFGRDSQTFANYFGCPKLLYDILLRMTVDSRDVLCRYDVALAGDTAKVLELNCSSAIGGWQTDWMLPAVREALGRYPDTSRWQVRHRAIFPELLRNVVQSIKRRKRGQAQGHIAMYSFVAGDAQRASLQACLQAVYDSIKPPHFSGGRIVLIADCAQLAFSAIKEVIANGTVVDAVLLTFPDAVDVPPAIFDGLAAAYLGGQIVFPDNPWHTLLDSKLLFAVAHAACERDLLTADDARIVREYIPWTATLHEPMAVWRGTRVRLAELLRIHQESFVLKKANSFGGRHVHVGRFTTPADWNVAIASCMAEHGWIAQEYCAPGQALLQHDTLGVVPHDLVWGVFGFGGQYGGSFIRARAALGTDGVINAAGGAIEHVVFEDLGGHGPDG